MRAGNSGHRMLGAKGHKQQGDVGGANAADAVGVSESRRAGGSELLATFGAESMNGMVIEIGGKANVFEVAEFLHLAQIAFEVATVADAVDDFFASRRRQGKKTGGEPRW